MLQEQTVVSDCYILQSRLGEDTCSEYWMATAIFSARRFLLRFLKSELSDFAKIEALRRKALESYNIRGEMVKDFVEIEDFESRIFVSSEYYDEHRLADFLATDYSMSLLHICRAIRMLAQGLLCFHEAGILYGILTPENIIVEIKDRELAVIKIVKPPIGFSTVGDTSAYLSPEIKKGLVPSQGSDIYSVGILTVRFITGKLPYPDNNIYQPQASLRYVTNALFRRNIPENFVRIILGMLVPDLSLRYGSCAELLHDLQQFMSFPEAETNQGSAIAERRPAVQDIRSVKGFDTMDYFNSLSGGEKIPDHANDRVYPLRTVMDQTNAESRELEELRIIPEEQSWTIDDYIAFGKRSISGTHEGLDAKTVASAAVKKEVNVIAAPPLLEPVPKLPFGLPAAAQTPSNASVAPAAPVSPVTPAAPVIPVALAPAPAVAESAIPESSNAGLNQMTVGINEETEKRDWAYHRIQSKDVYTIVVRAAQMATRGKGSFRYIQEPEGGYANTVLYQALERLCEKNFYVNAGSCARYGTANVGDFVCMLRKGIAAALIRESPVTIRRLAKKIEAADPAGLSRGAPLGKILYGRDSTEHQYPDFVDTATLKSIADALCAFTRKKKPLVLVVRGGERISRELQDFFNIISRTIPSQSICVVVFFEHIKFESWHTLSLISSL